MKNKKYKNNLIKAGLVLTIISSLAITSVPQTVFAGGSSGGSGSGYVRGPQSLIKTNIVIHKLQYNTDTIEKIQNTGEALPDASLHGAKLYDATKYGKVGFTIYKKVPQPKSDNSGSTTEVDNSSKNKVPTLSELKNTKLYTQVGDEQFFEAGTNESTNPEIRFNDLPSDTYYIAETTTPNNTVVAPAEIMVVELPVTNKAGDEILKDVHIYPKNKVQDVEFILHKVDEDGKDLQDITFTLYKGVPGSGTFVQKTQTGTDGKIHLKDLTIGDYYLVEEPTNGKVTDNPANDKNAEYLLGVNARNDENNTLRFSITDVGVNLDSTNMTLVNYKKPDADKKLGKPYTDLNVSRGAIVPFVSTVKIPKDIAGGEAVVGLDKITTVPYFVFNYTDTLTSHLLFPANEDKTFGPRNLKVRIGDVELQKDTDYKLSIKEGDANNKPQFVIDFITRGPSEIKGINEPSKPNLLKAPTYMKQPVPIDAIAKPRKPMEPDLQRYEPGSPEYLSIEENYKIQLEQYKEDLKIFNKTKQDNEDYKVYIEKLNAYNNYRDAMNLLLNNPKPSAHNKLSAPEEVKKPVAPADQDVLDKLIAFDKEQEKALIGSVDPIPGPNIDPMPGPDVGPMPGPGMPLFDKSKSHDENIKLFQDFTVYKRQLKNYNIYMAQKEQFDQYMKITSEIDNLFANENGKNSKEYAGKKDVLLKTLPVVDALDKGLMSDKEFESAKNQVAQYANRYLEDAKLYALNKEREQGFNDASNKSTDIANTLSGHDSGKDYAESINAYKEYLDEMAKYKSNRNELNSPRVSDKIKNNAGKNITITYELLVDGEVKERDMIINTMDMNYNNAPKGEIKTITKKTTQLTSDVQIMKYGDDLFGATTNKNDPLAGAEFILLRKTPDDINKRPIPSFIGPGKNPEDFPKMNMTQYEIYAGKDSRNIPRWVKLSDIGIEPLSTLKINGAHFKEYINNTGLDPDKKFNRDEAVFKSGVDGKITIHGLDKDSSDYEYSVVEIKAPEGYTLAEGMSRIFADSTHNDIKNKRNPDMPTTGSEKMLIGLGATVVLGAAAFGYEKHRKSKLKTQENHFEVK